MKARLLAGAVIVAPPPVAAEIAPPAERQKPIATIGTMKKGATADQRRLHHTLKRDMKKAARNIRHQQLHGEPAQRKE